MLFERWVLPQHTPVGQVQASHTDWVSIIHSTPPQRWLLFLREGLIFPYVWALGSFCRGQVKGEGGNLCMTKQPANGRERTWTQVSGMPNTRAFTTLFNYLQFFVSQSVLSNPLHKHCNTHYSMFSSVKVNLTGYPYTHIDIVLKCHRIYNYFILRASWRLLGFFFY